ncbi:polyprenyl synthetase family protein [Candidatus Bathyarchaeota archaeon]|nr:polyprenyl synthetase family protein [Candidatus Bathyarchaeota archaeon]
MGSKQENTAENVLTALASRSQKGLRLARRTMLAEEIKGKSILEALEMYFLNWANFIHPGLFSLACEASGGDPDHALESQAAMSMLAAAFDLHDDVIDRSKTKQGKPTVLEKFGRETAILLGDAFLVRGFTLFSESIENRSKKERRKIMCILRESLFELGNAHSLELGLRGRMDITPEEYEPILSMKAASLEADARIGGIIGGGRDDEVESLAKYGKIVGILATLREEFVDILDFKELRQRMKREYLPIPIQYAFRNKTERESILDVLTSQPARKKDLDGIILQSDGVLQLREKMETLATEADHQLDRLRESEAKHLLKRLLFAVMEKI